MTKVKKLRAPKADVSLYNFITWQLPLRETISCRSERAKRHEYVAIANAERVLIS